MRTSHKLTQFLLALSAIVALLTASFAQSPGATDIQVSDQKAGSVLVFPYYNSTANGTVDTRLTLTNVDDWYGTAVHLFFVDGACAQADMFVCLTPFGQVSIKASEMDPTIRGYLIAVAVNEDGTLRTFNRLIGNGFVKDGDFIGNYGAEAFWRHQSSSNNVILFGTDYDAAPNSFNVEIQSPVDSVQRLVQASLSGDLSAGGMNSHSLTGTGRIYNAQEVLKSVALGGSGCLIVRDINDANFRTAPRLSEHIKSGNGGTIVYQTSRGSVGLLMTGNKTPAQAAAPWSGIRTTHKRTQTNSSITIPVFYPHC